MAPESNSRALARNGSHEGRPGAPSHYAALHMDTEEGRGLPTGSTLMDTRRLPPTFSRTSSEGLAAPMLSQTSTELTRTSSMGTKGSSKPCRRWLCLLDRCCTVIDPTTSRFLQCWDIIIAVLLAFTALAAPFETAFLKPRMDALFVVDRIVDALFFVDMLLQFFIAYPDPARLTHLVRTPRRIVRHYLQGWFWVDFLSFSILPIDVCRVLRNHGGSRVRVPSTQSFEVLRFLRLVRLLRLARFSSLLKRWNTSWGHSYSTQSLVKFFVMVAVCCHWMACLWGGLAIYGEGDGTWLEALRESKGGSSERYQGAGRVYMISLYWAIISLTSIGYGDITPQTQLEYGIAAGCTAIMASVWAYVIGAVCGIVSTMQPHEASFQRTMDDLNWLMRDRQVPHNICIKLRRYFHETREMKRRRAENEIIDQMSPQLQGEFAHFMHKRWIEKVWYFATMPDEIIVCLARHLHMEVFCPHEKVISDRSLFIVQAGICALRGKILVSGDVWGEDMLLSNNILRGRHNARALSYLTVLQLHVQDVVQVVQNYHDARAKLRWAQVQIAIMRGVQKIAEVTRDLEKRGVLSHELSAEHRLDFYVDILHGRYNSKSFEEPLADCDYLGVNAPIASQATQDSWAEMEGGTKCSLNRSMKSSIASMCALSTVPNIGEVGEDHGQLARLTYHVESLGTGMADLAEKVDRLLSSGMQPGSGSARLDVPVHSHSGTMGASPSTMRLASTLRSGSRNSPTAFQDLGPLIMLHAKRQSSSKVLLGNLQTSGSYKSDFA